MLRILFAILLLLPLGQNLAAENCPAPEPVCAAREAVFAVEAFDPFASAVRIAPDLLVTNRHVVADQSRLTLILPDGGSVAAEVVPTAYEGDLVLLRSSYLPPGPLLEAVPPESEGEVYTVGADLRSGTVTVYPPGKIVALPPADLPSARIHSSAHSQPGNSGGALVDMHGRLIAIVTSGGEGRHEAIAATELEALRDASSQEHAAASAAIGVAYRVCTEALEAAHGRRLAELEADSLIDACEATNNRQMLDLAGQALGNSGHFEEAIALLKRSVADDPNAVNARISLAVTYHLARRVEEASPHLEHLLETAGEDLSVLRLIIQIGGAAGEREIVQRAYERISEYHPDMAPAARHFLEEEATPPPRR